jgi:hypothetical protein
MSAAINIQACPTPLMFGGVTGPFTIVQSDEAGAVQGDEAGNILTPDPEVTNVQGDENNQALTDEAGYHNIPDPVPGS